MLQERMVINECYILQSKIGEDSFTEHWIATAIFSATRFLLRFVKNSSENTLCLEGLRAEARRCYRVRGQFIADFVEVEFYGNQLFISSEYHDEQTLFLLIEKKKDWRLEQICIAVISLLRGLDAFHDQGIMYATLNAENVLVEKLSGPDYSFKIQKPSLIPLLPLLSADERYQAENYAYIAPEYKSGHTLCEGSDVYSLGIHLVRFFTGKLPFPDSVQSIQASTASLRYVTNALLRRGVPEQLIRIILHSLLADPARRYNSCIDMIRDLRLFMEKSEITTPEAANYFASLDEGAKAKNKPDDVLYPVQKFSDQERVDQLEKQELLIIPSEMHWSIDEYLENGHRTVSGEKGSEAVVTAHLPPEFILDKTVSGATTKAGAEASVASFRSEMQGKLAVSIDGSDDSFIAINQLEEISGTREKNINWNYLKVRFQDVRVIVDLSIKRAHKGKGSFRYIQEPVSEIMNADLFKSFETLKKDCLYINLGTCARFGKANTADFLQMLRQGIAREIAGETKSSLKLRAREIAVHDTFAIFKSSPLGSILYGSDGAEIKGSKLKGKLYHESIVHSLLAFARKKKPLVMVIRGGESISLDLHRLFIALAGGVRESPVCVLVFFEHTRFDSWHALSAVPKK